MGLESFFGSNEQAEVSIHSTGDGKWRDATKRRPAISFISPEEHQVESNEILPAMEYTPLSVRKFLFTGIIDSSHGRRKDPTVQ